MNDKNGYTTRLMAVAVLLGTAGCSKPSDRYQGISEPREITSERSPATRPSLPSSASGQGTGSAARVSPTSDDTDSPGTTNLLPVANDYTVPRATLAQGGELSLIGRAIVIHEKRDEGRRSQPSGDSGPPVACAVIEAS